MEPLFVILAVAVMAVVGYFSWKAEKQRREAFQHWAAQHGWSYRPEKDGAIRRQYGFLDRMQVGHSRRAFNVLRGEWEGRAAAAFTFRYKTGSGKNETTHWFGVALIHIERPFPELRIHPEGIFSRIGQAMGFDDIDFESVDFSRAFTVRSRDKKFAFDFCHTGTMEYLLQHRSTALELEGGTLALFVDRRLEAAHLTPLLQQATHLRDLMPAYLFRA